MAYSTTLSQLDTLYSVKILSVKLASTCKEVVVDYFGDYPSI